MRRVLILSLAWALAILALLSWLVPAAPCSCTTDTDCMQCGGDGSPESST